MSGHADPIELDAAARERLRRCFGAAMDGPPPRAAARVLDHVRNDRGRPPEIWLAAAAAGALALLVAGGLLIARHQVAGTPRVTVATAPCRDPGGQGVRLLVAARPLGEGGGVVVSAGPLPGGFRVAAVCG